MTEPWHITRRWQGGDKEWFGDECPCEPTLCGYVISSDACPQHGFRGGKTLRGGHSADACPGGLTPIDPKED